MATPVELPKTGNSVEECVISRWVKHPGDAVNAGDVLAEVETDKASFEVSAPTSGTVLAIFFDEGTLVPVFTTICVIGETGESIEGYRPAAALRAGGEALVAGRHDPPVSVPQPVPSPRSPVRSAIRVSPRAQRVARELDVDARLLRGTGPKGRIVERDVRSAQPARAKGFAVAADSLRATVDATSLQKLRAQIESLGAKKAPDITVAELAAFCAIRAATNGALLRSPIHLRFISQTPQRLTDAVVTHADQLSLPAMSAEIKKGRDGRATFTIEVASIAVGTLDLTFRFDESASDSAAVRRFLSSVKDIVEHAEYHLILRGS